MKIVVFKSKHEDEIYDASTPDKLHKAYLKVVRERAKYYYYEPDFYGALNDEEKALLSIPEETVKNLPELIVNKIKKVKEKLEETADDYEEELLWWSELQRILPMSDEEAINAVTLPWEGSSRPENTLQFILDHRIEGEYECFYTVTLPEL